MRTLPPIPLNTQHSKEHVEMDLRGYIKEELKRGHDAYSLRYSLIRQGYSQDQVDSAFDAVMKTNHSHVFLVVGAIILILGIFSYATYFVIQLNKPSLKTYEVIETLKDKPTEPPEEFEAASAASCYDGVKNCHSGKCEAGIDCGGPCSLCYWQVEKTKEKPDKKKQEKIKVSLATCDDGILNGLEAGVDCGGSCKECIVASTSLTNLEMLEKAKRIGQHDPQKALQACDEFSSGFRDSCIGEIAKMTNNHVYCERIKSEIVRDGCYTDFAIAGNTEVCEKIQDLDLRYACSQLKNLAVREA